MTRIKDLDRNIVHIIENRAYGYHSLHVGHKRISKNKKNHDFDKLDHSSEMLI